MIKNRVKYRRTHIILRPSAIAELHHIRLPICLRCGLQSEDASSGGEVESRGGNAGSLQRHNRPRVDATTWTLTADLSHARGLS